MAYKHPGTWNQGFAMGICKVFVDSKRGAWLESGGSRGERLETWGINESWRIKSQTNNLKYID